MVTTPVTSITFEEYLTPLKAKVSVLLLEDGFYEETVFTATQEIVSRTFPELAIPAAHFVNAVDQVFAAGNLNQGS